MFWGSAVDYAVAALILLVLLWYTDWSKAVQSVADVCRGSLLFVSGLTHMHAPFSTQSKRVCMCVMCISVEHVIAYTCAAMPSPR